MSYFKKCASQQKMIDHFAPKVVWERKELSPRDRSLITVSNLITSQNTELLKIHLNLAKENGLSEEELFEVITHLSFYAGFPKAMSAIIVAKELFSNGNETLDNR